MSLLGVIGSLLPLGVAAALSSVPMAVAIAILLSKQSTRNGVAYVIGQFAGAMALTSALSSGLALFPDRRFHSHHLIIGTTELAIGLILVGYGLYRLLRRQEPTKPSSQGWMQHLATIGAWAAFGIGVGLNFRPKALLLALAAGLAIGSGDLTVAETLLAAGVYSVFATSVVAGAVIAHVTNPAATARWLEAARIWLKDHGQLVTLIVTVLIGVVILGNGLSRIAQ